ncbi:MAG: type II toxin-antitoxin system VapC family toxin [Cytophagales bacterium]|nr:type II toxin-antitoxin system VapC family toxin [Cytophagales bacterium]
MENKLILIDTSIPIDFYRKKLKEKTVWYNLLKQGYSFSVSVVTKYELLCGADNMQSEYWDKVFDEILVLPFDNEAVLKAVEINKNLMVKSKQIDMADLFIAATALSNGLSISTLNKKHFERIDELIII